MYFFFFKKKRFIPILLKKDHECKCSYIAKQINFKKNCNRRYKITSYKCLLKNPNSKPIYNNNIRLSMTNFKL